MTVQIPDALLAELSFDPYVLRAWDGPAAPNGFLMAGTGWPRAPRAAGLRMQYVTPSGGVVRLCTMDTAAPDDRAATTTPQQADPRQADMKLTNACELAAVAAARDLGELTFAGDPENGVVPDEPAPGLTALVWRHVHDRARDWRSWPQLTWTVDGRPISASTWQFAGGSCGFAVVDRVGITCTAFGVPLEGLDLVTAPRRGAAPSGAEVLLLDAASRQTAPGFARPNLAGWHADHLALLSPAGRARM